MKKLVFTVCLLAFCGMASAQKDRQANQDKIQQEPPPPAQQQTERSSAIDARAKTAQKQSEKELEAEMRAKQKGQTARQTKTQPNSGVAPTLNDTLHAPKKKAKTPQP